MKLNRIYFAIYCLLLIIICLPLQAQEGDSEKKLSYVEDHPYKTIQVKEPNHKTVKNVILMIGDGMGIDQVAAAWIANHGHLNFDNFHYIGLSRTWAENRLITDSGASGTAMATGQKTNYHSIGVDVQGKALSSLSKLAHEKGLSTGIVVTCGLTDATPAAFCAHNIDRDKEEEIALDFLDCDVDYLFGGGRGIFEGRSDQRNLFAEMKAIGYEIPDCWEETKKIRSGKVFSVLTKGQLPLAGERGPLFQEACVHALSLLEKNEKGFFAMLEGSRIDDCGHWNNLPLLMGEMFDFDQAIGRVLKWAEKDGETLVVVLADHETGGLSILDGDIGKGEVKGKFSTNGHSGILVPVYAYGPGAEEFMGIYENTEVFAKIASLLNLKTQ
jgi:alkaline phosphatase